MGSEDSEDEVVNLCSNFNGADEVDLPYCTCGCLTLYLGVTSLTPEGRWKHNDDGQIAAEMLDTDCHNQSAKDEILEEKPNAPGQGQNILNDWVSLQESIYNVRKLLVKVLRIIKQSKITPIEAFLDEEETEKRIMSLTMAKYTKEDELDSSKIAVMLNSVDGYDMFDQAKMRKEDNFIEKKIMESESVVVWSWIQEKLEEILTREGRKVTAEVGQLGTLWTTVAETPSQKFEFFSRLFDLNPGSRSDLIPITVARNYVGDMVFIVDILERYRNIVVDNSVETNEQADFTGISTPFLTQHGCDSKETVKENFEDGYDEYVGGTSEFVSPLPEEQTLKFESLGI
ncbi:hypothetical protein GIB67_030843 [Kingdonia uniflora]|uniref:Eukaryotic translation initiation factor 3 subunit C N-terminal domain-containing protein n=1 Tax=Kingdonia uniflora TaxID=39325 RepID=A0A7J7L3C6_9MAGN|nr:hypothetical protein GIB67_030843 [Kingdonia uniflora]